MNGRHFSRIQYPWFTRYQGCNSTLHISLSHTFPCTARLQKLQGPKIWRHTQHRSPTSHWFLKVPSVTVQSLRWTQGLCSVKPVFQHPASPLHTIGAFQRLIFLHVVSSSCGPFFPSPKTFQLILPQFQNQGIWSSAFQHPITKTSQRFHLITPNSYNVTRLNRLGNTAIQRRKSLSWSLCSSWRKHEFK